MWRMQHGPCSTTSALGNLRIKVRSDGLVLVSRTESVGIVDVDPHDFEM